MRRARLAAMDGDLNALFAQYENEYCNKSTDISRKITAASSLSGGKLTRGRGAVVDVRSSCNPAVDR